MPCREAGGSMPAAVILVRACFKRADHDNQGMDGNFEAEKLMHSNRRQFIVASAGLTGALSLSCGGDKPPERGGGAPASPASILALRPMTGGIVPIADDERRARMEKARRLMAENKIDAVYIEGGSTMFYFTGVRWGTSERMFALILPAKGELAWVCPKFEEDRARELIRFGSDIRTWEEDESPYRVVAGIFNDRGIRAGRIGVEERVRFFLYDGIRKESPGLEYVSADPVSAGCRTVKSPAEIALMQKAFDITIEAFRAGFATLQEGMTQGDFRRNIESAFRALGAEGSGGPSFGKSTSFPHGCIQPQKLQEGDVVLVDGGCAIEGYRSDVTRTTVFGKPTQKQTDVWELEKRAQSAAFAAAKLGVPCEEVDAAARRVITDAGFGPDYRLPGLPHRTGHGIGLDGHEWTNLVRGNRTPLAAGMCFSDEPMIVIPGEFGIRLEDCFYMTDAGAKFFTEQSPSIDRPFA
jgi:Xaa-Pro dipeptidase